MHIDVGLDPRQRIPRSPELRIMKLKESIKLMLILPLFLLSRRCGHHRLSFCRGPHPAVGPDTVFHCSQSSELTLPASWARRHPQIKDNGTEASLLFQTSVTSPSFLPTASWPRRASASHPTNGSIPWSNPGQPSGALSNTQPAAFSSSAECAGGTRSAPSLPRAVLVAGDASVA